MLQRDQNQAILTRSFSLEFFIRIAALLFAAVAGGAFFYGIYAMISRGSLYKPSEGPLDLWREIIAPNSNIIAIIMIGLICALFSLRLFSKAGSLTSQIIRTEDRALLEPLIQIPNKEAIGEYIRLASLSGFSGTFTMLGFTGLPLATVVLTLILLFVAIYVTEQTLRQSIFDMAKLTLGAFLGSFVQRNIEQEKLVAGTGPSTTSIPVTVTPTPTPPLPPPPLNPTPPATHP